MYKYNCIIKRIVDGDTVDVDIDLGFDVWMNNQRIRISGVDAPETRTRDLEEKAAGFESKAFVEGLLPVGSKQVLITTQYNSSGKYGRIIGTFELYDASKDAWSDLSTMLLESGHAETY
jgi:micrococcal nuclease